MYEFYIWNSLVKTVCKKIKGYVNCNFLRILLSYLVANLELRELPSFLGDCLINRGFNLIRFRSEKLVRDWSPSLSKLFPRSAGLWSRNKTVLRNQREKHEAPIVGCYRYCWMRLVVVVRAGERLSTWSASVDHVWRPSSWGWALTIRNWGDYEDCGFLAAPKSTLQSTGRNWWVYHTNYFSFIILWLHFPGPVTAICILSRVYFFLLSLVTLEF